MYSRYIKRLFDIIVSIFVLPLVIPIIAVFGLLVWLEDNGDVFYLAERRGLNGQVFKMYKLRSMKMNAPDIRNSDNSTFNSLDDPRVTRIGKIMRKASIDELPQIFNVLKGEMSWVGPRPVTTDKPLSEYDQKRLDRLKVRPGITGYAQAYYRNNIDQEEKLALDAEYAKKISLKFDIQIILQTIRTVLNRENIYTN